MGDRKTNQPYGAYAFDAKDPINPDECYKKLTLWKYTFKQFGPCKVDKFDDVLLKRKGAMYYAVPDVFYRYKRQRTEYRYLSVKNIGKLKNNGSTYVVWLDEDNKAKAMDMMIEHLEKRMVNVRREFDRILTRRNDLVKEREEIG